MSDGISEGGSRIIRHPEALVELLDGAGLTELVDPERPSLVTPKRGFFKR
jgi:hypothetical protein